LGAGGGPPYIGSSAELGVHVHVQINERVIFFLDSPLLLFVFCIKHRVGVPKSKINRGYNSKFKFVYKKGNWKGGEGNGNFLQKTQKSLWSAHKIIPNRVNNI